jgi:hypothetical protein
MRWPTAALFSILIVLGLDAAALGAEGRAAEGGSSRLVLLILLAPTVLVLLVWALLARKSGVMKQGGYMVKADKQMDRSVEHMASMEQKADRMIELLDSINRRLRDGV